MEPKIDLSKVPVYAKVKKDRTFYKNPIFNEIVLKNGDVITYQRIPKKLAEECMKKNEKYKKFAALFKEVDQLFQSKEYTYDIDINEEDLNFEKGKP
jgi:hypothetical protein